MGQVHQLLTQHGKQGVLELGLARDVVEAAATYMAQEGRVDELFTYSGFALAGLPHRRLDDDVVWKIATDHMTLLVQPGVKLNSAGDPVPVGVPYGSRARLICLYLQTTALRTGSREVPLGKSLREWLHRMSISWGGKSIAMVRDQAERIARCRLSFEIKNGNRTGLVNQNIMDAAMFEDDADGGRTFLDQAILSEGFFQALTRHPVPIEEPAILALSNNSMAMDIYIWLAYRLHCIDGDRPMHITWKALAAQFGPNFTRARDFRLNFRNSLELALSVYPDAVVRDEERGLVLHRSKPPVAPRIATFSIRH